MEFVKALIMGLVQGLTEFLPISSSGHLVLTEHFLGIGESADISFEIFVHLGSLIAVLIFFRKEWILLLKSLWYYKKPELKNYRLVCLWITIATLITAVVGFTLKNVLISLYNPYFVSVMLVITGGILFLSDKIPSGILNAHDLDYKKSIFIGLGQAFAILPGISRSGATITASLLTGLDRKAAASFSFLLSIPAILGANILEIKNFTSLESSMMVNYLIGFLAAFVSGYFVISGLIKLIAKAKLSYFAYYCWAISILSIILLLYNI